MHDDVVRAEDNIVKNVFWSNHEFQCCCSHLFEQLQMLQIIIFTICNEQKKERYFVSIPLLSLSHAGCLSMSYHTHTTTAVDDALQNLNRLCKLLIIPYMLGEVLLSSCSCTGAGTSTSMSMSTFAWASLPSSVDTCAGDDGGWLARWMAVVMVVVV